MTRVILLLSLLCTDLIGYSNDLIRYYNGEIMLSEKRVLSLCDSIENSESSHYLLALAHYQRAIQFRNKKDNISAFENYDLSFTHLLKSDTSDSYIHSAILRNQGIILAESGFTKQAAELHERAMPHGYDYSNLRGLSLKHNLGRIYAKIDQKKALEIYLEALGEAEELYHSKRQASLMISIGLILMETTAYDSAISYMERSTTISNDSANIAWANHNISEVYAHQNNFKKQKEFLIKSLEYLTDSQRFHGLVHLGKCLIALNDTRAQGVLLEAESYYSKQAVSEENIEVYQLLEQLFPDSTQYISKRANEFEKLSQDLRRLEEIQKKLTLDQVIRRLESEKDKKSKVAWYKMLAVIGAISTLFILLTWKIWWFRLRNSVGEKVNESLGR